MATVLYYISYQIGSISGAGHTPWLPYCKCYISYLIGPTSSATQEWIIKQKEWIITF